MRNGILVHGGTVPGVVIRDGTLLVFISGVGELLFLVIHGYQDLEDLGRELFTG